MAAPIQADELRIVTYPARVLLQRAQAVGLVNAEVRSVAGRMIELMYEAQGIGLAAPQVGLPWRMFVADVPAPRDDEPDSTRKRLTSETDPALPFSTQGPVVYVNPRLDAPKGVPEAVEEGCLSLPDIRGEVLRPPIVTITATDLEGREFTQTGSGLLARCWQHEVDHLDGVLILSRMTQRSRLKNRAPIRDLERGAERSA
ncbi:MAG: peptide deformylase [Phycisphaeraceae bacterium]|nr:peptide deformylase [Phycisphaeraceae bacterium]